jgi:hypothetical protein
MDNEEWRPVPSVPGMLASSLGRIKAATRRAPMHHGGERAYVGKPWVGAWDGARYITRFRGKNYKVARLVCEAFHGAPPAPRAVCMHLDEDARNNNPGNLQWGTQRQNLNFPGYLRNLRSRGRLLTTEQATEIRERRQRGELLAAIAAAYGIDFRLVSAIALGQRYAETRA